MTINPKKGRPNVGSFEPMANRAMRWAVPVVVAVVTLVVFSEVVRHGFVDWDDNRILIENGNYRGLGWLNLQWMFTTFYKSLYRPLTWVSFGFDYLFWGMNPFGYHLSSLLLHTLNSVLVYRVAFLLYSLPPLGSIGQGDSSRKIVAGIAALLFSIHPLRVESVAWVSARNDLL